jgi:hypothetical protein
MNNQDLGAQVLLEQESLKRNCSPVLELCCDISELRQNNLLLHTSVDCLVWKHDAVCHNHLISETLTKYCNSQLCGVITCSLHHIKHRDATLFRPLSRESLDKVL